MKSYPEPPEGLRVHRDGSVLRLTLDRPGRRNALTDPMVAALIDTVEAAGSDEEVRVIALDGAGDNFCSGFDLAGRRGDGTRPRVGSIQRRMPYQVNRLIGVLCATQTPVVTVARGQIAGLGLGLVVAADFAVVAQDATLSAPFGELGFTPDSGLSWMLPRLAGPVEARRMLILGESLTGADAVDAGLVHQAVSGPDLEAAGDALVARLAESPTVAVGLTKWLIATGLGLDLDHHLHQEAFAMELSSRSQDFREAMAARGEDRPPRFTGR